MDYQTAMLYRQKIEQAAISLPDGDALEAPEMFPHWKPDMNVVANERIYYESILYRVVQSHKTQEGWEPDKTPALFTAVPSPREVPVWKQPTGAQDAYMAGDKVHYLTKDDPVWESTVDYNTWQPGVYGWEEV